MHRLAAALLLIPALGAQPARPEFDVASLKPAVDTGRDLIQINLGRFRNGELTMGNATLGDCIRFAYGLTSDSQVAGPDWIKDKRVRFDIIAKAPPDTPQDRVQAMLQKLLTERFQMTIHREERELPAFRMVVGKSGSKMKVAEPQAQPGFSGLGRIVSARMSMLVLANLLARFELDAPVLDMTGLPGFYEVKLEWTPERRPAVNPTAATAAVTEAVPGPNLASAIQQQLGLKLEPRKGPVEVIVVDRAEQVPIAN